MLLSRVTPPRRAGIRSDFAPLVDKLMADVHAEVLRDSLAWLGWWR